jgi:Carboxypeptidase regulatory-like domain
MKTIRPALAALTYLSIALAQRSVVPETRHVEAVVVDHQNARIFTAKVTLVDEKTNLSITANPDETGIFSLDVSPGSYTLKAESTCFAPFVQRQIDLNDILKLRIDVRLSVLKDCRAGILGVPDRRF